MPELDDETLDIDLSGLQFSKESQCDGKFGYPTEESAQRNMLRFLTTKGISIEDFNTYQCPHCSLYHFGHIPGRKARIAETSAEEKEAERGNNR